MSEYDIRDLPTVFFASDGTYHLRGPIILKSHANYHGYGNTFVLCPDGCHLCRPDHPATVDIPPAEPVGAAR